MQARQEGTAGTAAKYRQATKKEKKAILDQFVMTTGCRWHARFLLRSHGKRLQVDQQRVLVADVRKQWPRSKRPRVYDEKVLVVLPCPSSVG